MCLYQQIKQLIIIVVCKCYYLEVICKELGLWPGTTSSDTYGTHSSYKKFLGFKEDNLSDKVPGFYWTPKLHKTLYKHRFIASLFDCTIKPLSVLLNRYLICHQRELSNLSSVILKNSSELVKKMNSFHYPKITSIQPFDFSTPYTSIPHQKT